MLENLGVCSYIEIWVCVHCVLVEDELRYKFMYFLNFNSAVVFF